MWNRIACSRKQLRFDLTLVCGQSFRWQELEPGHWTSVLAGHVWTLKQTDEALYYRVHTKSETKHPVKTTKKITSKHDKSILYSSGGDSTTEKEDSGKHSHEQILRDYFQLEIDLNELYHKWSKVDPNFKSKALDFTGIRILRQDPVENLFSFICSSNNNISRISLMVERMCEKYGTKLLEIDGKSYHSFPTIDDLASEGVEEELRGLGFGYRARYIAETARYIRDNHSVEWLYRLRELPYDDAKSELIKLCGVGAKVADCVCLMSLDKHGAIPVDTHVWQIVTRDYKQAHLAASKTVTNAVYQQVGNFFRSLWGEYAGWAHSVLFSADLKKFQDVASSPKKRKASGNGKTVTTAKNEHEKGQKKEKTTMSH